MTSPPPACQHARFVLSAVLDGAADADEEAAVEGHLATCPSCTEHRRRLDELSYLVSRSVVPPAPDVASALGSLVPEAPTRRTRSGSPPSLARYLLATVATAQILLGLPALVVGRGAGEVHTSRHLGAWAVAFGVGLLLAAIRPRHARTLLPVAATLTAAVAVTMVIDVLGGHRAPTPEALHLLEAGGLGLVALVHRRAGPGYRGVGRSPAVPLTAGG